MPGDQRYTRRTVLAAMAGGAVVAGAAGYGTRVLVEDDNDLGDAFKLLSDTAVKPLARSQHATVLLVGGLVLCIGGVGATGTLTSCQIFDPRSREWYDAPPLPSPRSGHSATRIDAGRILVLGGQAEGTALATASIFDPRAGEWSKAKPLRTPRYNHAADTLPDGRVAVTGGVAQGPQAAAEIYIPS